MGETIAGALGFTVLGVREGGGPKYTMLIISVSIGPFLAFFGERVDDWTAWRWPVTKVDFGQLEWPGQGAPDCGLHAHTER